VLSGLESEALAAAGASTVQYLATTFGCHTGAEAMGAGAFQYAGLKCSFHSNDPSVCEPELQFGQLAQQ
jgi:hypothetical protein